MNVDLIVTRFIEGLQYVDAHTTTVTSARSGEAYLPGVQSMNERTAVGEVVAFWTQNYPSDFKPSSLCRTEQPYPESAAKKADIVFDSLSIETDNKGAIERWAVEAKRFQFVGDNGKNNDFGVAKMFSPYLKDSSLSHDAHRLAESAVATRKVVLVYGFEYDLSITRQSLKIHPTHAERIKNIERVCKNNDPISPGINFDLLITRVGPNLKEVVEVRDFADRSATGLWRHPCGGRIRVLGWEICSK